MTFRKSVKSLRELWVKEETAVPPGSPWELTAFVEEQCLSYFCFNHSTKELLVVDPLKNDFERYLPFIAKLKADHSSVKVLGVIDTHTHADHISCGSELARELGCDYIMSDKAPSKRPTQRIKGDTTLKSLAGDIACLETAGHTPDSLTVFWGPFIFGGDNLLFGDTGRDDLPGGNPEAHFHGMQKVVKNARPDHVLLPGHDHRDGRASTWAYQLKVSASLTQGHDEFVKEASAFKAPMPKLLEESIRENSI